jgi:hypothetical protein
MAICSNCSSPQIETQGDEIVCNACGEHQGSPVESDEDYCDDMDGDAESAFASCGWGTDESYEHFDSDC